MKINFIEQKGFTLVELLVVIAVISLLTAVTLPNYREGSRQLALDRATHKLAQDIRRAQEMAMSMQQIAGNPEGYGIYFSKVPSGGNYDVYLYADFSGNEQYGSGEEIETIYKEDQGIYLENGIIIKDINAEGANPDKISFNFQSPDPIVKLRTDSAVDYSTVTVTLSLKNDNNITKKVIINGAGLIYAE